MLEPKTEVGFREEASGLLVPESTARQREIWPKADVKAIDRATRILKAYGLKFQFACESCGVRHPMTLTRDSVTGQRVLRCGHKDRILSGAI